MVIIATLALSCICALVLTPLMISLAKKKNIIDHPRGDLKTHAQPTPYLGGVALYFALLLSCFLLQPLSLWMLLFLTGAGFLCFTGLIDDIFTLDPTTKFLTQSAGCATLLISLSSMTGITPSVSVTLASLFFMFTVVNAVNLVDIMDSLAGTVCLTTLIGSATLSWYAKSPLLFCELATIGGLLGFLWYNKKPARVYLGDAGSLLLGGIIGFFILKHSWQYSFSQNFFVIPSLVGVALIELVSLIIIRTKLGIPFYLGSPHHFAQYLKRAGWSWLSIIGFVFAAGMALNGLVIAYAQGFISFKTVWLLLSAGLIPWLYIIYAPSNAKGQSQDRR